jgi:transcriptional regulator with XRE-family HTH domain
MTPREQLADVLQRARIDAGFESHAALAKRLNVSRPVVSKAENPAQPVPSDAILAAWAGATGVPLDTLTDLAQRAKSGTPEWFMPYRQAEAEAHTLRCWAPTVIPGLLQCESYASTLFDCDGHSPSKIKELVTARISRQKVIGRAHITVVIDWHVLYRLVGSPAIMAEQCAYVASMAEQRNISLHVLPEGINVGVGGALDIATQDHTTTVCLTTGLDDVTSTASDVVARSMQSFERILGAAMPGSESIALTRTVEGQWKAQI